MKWRVLNRGKFNYLQTRIFHIFRKITRSRDKRKKQKFHNQIFKFFPKLKLATRVTMLTTIITSCPLNFHWIDVMYTTADIFNRFFISTCGFASGARTRDSWLLFFRIDSASISNYVAFPVLRDPWILPYEGVSQSSESDPILRKKRYKLLRIYYKIWKFEFPAKRKTRISR